MNHSESKQSYCVYFITTPDKKAYVGATSRKPEARWGKGNNYKFNKPLNNAIKKYGWDNTKHVVFAENLSREQAFEMEEMLIALFDTTNPSYGYNISHGGPSSMKGRHHTEETRQIMSQKASLRIYSDEYRQQCSLRLRKRISTDRTSFLKFQKAGSASDHTWSEEHRKKFHDARIGHKVSEKTKRKLSTAHTGQHHTKEAKEKIAQAQYKRVVCLENGIIYESIMDAACETGIHRETISAVCRGKGQTAGGFHFKFLKDCCIPYDFHAEIVEIDAHCGKEVHSVLCIETGEIYRNIAEAAKMNGIQRKGISMVCNGIRNTAGGFHWKFLERTYYTHKQ